jgi:hypothetical protein
LKLPNIILENPNINTHKVVAGKYQRNPIADESEDEKLVNRTLSKAGKKPSLRRGKGAQGQLRTVTTVQWRIFAEKYKPGMCFTYGNRDHWSDIAAQILKNVKDKYLFVTL